MSRAQSDAEDLARKNCLDASFEIPDAASRLNLVADLSRRTLTLSMRLDAPKDRSRPIAVINWFTRQLSHSNSEDIIVRAYWPRRHAPTGCLISIARDDPKQLLHPDIREVPVALEVLQVIDLSGRFRGVRTFVEETEHAVPEFYESIGQHLQRWVPSPPRIKPSHDSETREATEDSKAVSKAPIAKEQRLEERQPTAAPPPRASQRFSAIVIPDFLRRN